MSSSGGESTDVVEIDAIGVDEWEHEQHTPVAMDENMAALVKSSAQSGPARAPTIDDGWEADPAKQRTTTNTVARPGSPKLKTMAMPTIAAVRREPAAPKPVATKPATPKASAVPQPVPRVETKAIVSPAAKKIGHTGDEPPPGFVEVKPLAARAAAKPPSAKPAAKPTPPPMAAISPKPAAPPQPIAVVSAEPKPPLPLSSMTLPAWPPANEVEDWDSPQSAATSVGNRVSPSRPVSTDFRAEDSVIVDLDAKPRADKPRRPQSYPVIQTSEQKPSTSGAFVMPTAAQPNATPVAPERVSAPELPPPPVAVVGGSSRPDGDRASSPGWNTPLPQRLHGEPISAPAPPLAAKRTVVAALLPLVRRRGVVIAIAGATVLAVVLAIGLQASRDSKQPTIVATSAPPSVPTASAESTSTHVAPTRTGAMPAHRPIAAVETIAPSPKVPAKRPVAMRRISRNKKPVVVDYDKKPTPSSLDADQALEQARAAYSIGNQHLFAGEGREAVTEYRRALSIDPSYAAGYRGLGLAFAQLDDKPSAIAAFKKYVKLAPLAKDVALIQKRIRNLSVR